MRLIFADAAWEDYLYWQEQDKRMVVRISKLIKETMRDLLKVSVNRNHLSTHLPGFGRDELMRSIGWFTNWTRML